MCFIKNMYGNVANKNNSINFGLRIRLSDKGLLNLSQKPDILYASTPLDFFYREPKNKQKLDALSIKIKERIRQEQRKANNSNIKKMVLNKCYVYANKLRALASKFLVYEHLLDFYKSFKLIKNLTPASPQYIVEWAKIGNSIHNKFIEMNIEDGKIEEIAKSGEPHIFLLNHNNPEKDKFIYPIFNSFLNYAYTAFGRQNDCPRPNIIVSHNVLDLVNNKFRNIYKKMGLIPVDASLSERKADKNVLPVRYLIEKFIHKKSNLFIFPEGNNSIYKDKPLKDKFQPGVAKIVKNILDVKESVRIVPLGLSYTRDKNNMGSVHIGDTILLRRKGNQIYRITDSGIEEFLCNSNAQDVTGSIKRLLCLELEKSVVLSKIE